MAKPYIPSATDVGFTPAATSVPSATPTGGKVVGGAFIPSAHAVGLGPAPAAAEPKKEASGFLAHGLLGGIIPANPVTRELQRFDADVINMGIFSIAGAYHGADKVIHDPGVLLSNPIPTAVDLAKSFAHSLTPGQIIEHPGYAIANTVGLAGGAGAVGGRAASAAQIAARQGAIKESLAAAIAKARIADPMLTPQAAARAVGREAEYTRAIKVNTNPGTVDSMTPRTTKQQIIDTILHGDAPEERLLKINPDAAATHGWWYSKNPAIKAAQKLVDRQYDAFPADGHIPIWRAAQPWLWKSQAQRVRSATLAENVIEKSTERAAGKEFAKKWGPVDDVFHLVARMVGEGTTPKDLRIMHEREIAGGKLNGRQQSETVHRLTLIPETNKYISYKTHTLSNGAKEKVPVLKDPAKLADDNPLKAQLVSLHEYVNEARAISDKRTHAARLVGLLSEASHFGRTVAPRNYAKYGELPESISRLKRKIITHENLNNTAKVRVLRDRLAKAEGQLTLDHPDLTVSPHAEGLLTSGLAKELSEKAGLFRVPYELEGQGLASFGSTAFRRPWKGGRKDAPSTFTHHFNAEILKHGGGDLNTAKLLAESYTEAHRFFAFQKNYRRIIASGQKTPKGIPPERRVLMRTDEKIPHVATFKGASQKALGGFDNPDLTNEEAAVAGQVYDGIREHYFPKATEALKTLSQNAINALLKGEDSSKFQEVPGYVWVDQRQLGGLDKENPLRSAFTEPKARSVLKLIDTVNNAQKFAILFLKPAYAIPNFLGNAALALVQQGFMAPWNLAKSAFIQHVLDPSTVIRIRQGMGGGISDQLRAPGVSGAVSRVVNATSGAYGKVIDDPFRMASFLHEARTQGYKSKEELHALTHDAALEDQYRAILNRANDEIINYERLGPGEQAVLKRLIFFYPWVKGSTRYGAQFAKSHPVAAGATGFAGQQGKEWVDSVIGESPVYAEGLIPYRGPDKYGHAQVGNPASMAILSQPAEYLEKAINLISDNPNPDLSFLSELAPADAGLLAFFGLGRDSTIAQPPNQNPILTGLKETFGGNPIKKLYEDLTGGPARPNSLYPDNSAVHALVRFLLLGGLTPRDYNVAKGQNIAYQESHPSSIPYNRRG